MTPLQYEVTQHEGTERPFSNEYWNNKQEGIYVDIVSGEPLFSSLDKYNSGTGWPSFTRPLEPDNIATHTDYKLFMARTEVRSKHANSHLGHLFDVRSRADRFALLPELRRAEGFIPVEQLEEEGYGEYLSVQEGIAPLLSQPVTDPVIKKSAFRRIFVQTIANYLDSDRNLHLRNVDIYIYLKYNSFNSRSLPARSCSDLPLSSAIPSCRPGVLGKFIRASATQAQHILHRRDGIDRHR